MPMEPKHYKPKDPNPTYHYRIGILIGTTRFETKVSNADDALTVLDEVFDNVPGIKRNGVNFKKIFDDIETGRRASYNACPICIDRILDRY